MFVRAKTVKENQYGYLVENAWQKGKVRQKVKQYLGRIISLNKEDVAYKTSFEVDFSSSKKECIQQLICIEFFKKGFVKDGDTLKKDDIVISLRSGKIMANNKHVVLFLNGRYLYKGLLEDLLDFFQPEAEADKKGEKLAQAFSDAGIRILPEHFISLYKKIYVETN